MCPTHTALSWTLRQKHCILHVRAPGRALLPSYQGQQLRLLRAERNQTIIFIPGGGHTCWVISPRKMERSWCFDFFCRAPVYFSTALFHEDIHGRGPVDSLSVAPLPSPFPSATSTHVDSRGGVWAPRGKRPLQVMGTFNALGVGVGQPGAGWKQCPVVWTGTQGLDPAMTWCGKPGSLRVEVCGVAWLCPRVGMHKRATLGANPLPPIPPPHPQTHAADFC